MADQARGQTDEILDGIERQLRAQYKMAEEDMRKKWDVYLKNADKELEDYRNEYLEAKRSGSRDAIRAAGLRLQRAAREKTVQDKRFRDIIDQLARAYTDSNKVAAAFVNGQLPSVYAMNYNAFQKSIGLFVRGYSFSLVDPNVVRRLMDFDNWLKLDKTMDIRWNNRKIREQVLQGILQGESMSDIADRISKVTDMNLNSALRCARTAVTGAENAGRQDSIDNAVAAGMKVEKLWIATEDSRTRDTHRDQNGKHVPHDKAFPNGCRFPGDPAARPEEIMNCRCTLGYYFP